MDEVEVSQINGKSVPTAGRLTFTVKLSKGETQVSTDAYQFTQIDLNPDLSAQTAFRPTLEEGTPITNLDDTSGVAYEWRDGKVVKTVDSRVEDQVAGIPAAAYPGASGSDNFWLDWKVMTAGCLLLLVGAIAFAVWFFRKREHHDAQA